MNAHTDVQIIRQSGKPAFAVLPYEHYLSLVAGGNHERDDIYIPHEVVALMVKQGLNPIGAWRSYLNISQEELAKRLGTSQPNIVQLESSESPRKATRVKVAKALHLLPEQLDI